MNDGKKKRPSILGWILIAAGLFFLSAALANEGRLALFGKMADGVVEKVTEESHRDSTSWKEAKKRGDDRKANISHRLHVKFSLPSGESAGFATLSTFGSHLKPSDPVKVIYLSDDIAGAEIYSARQLWLPLATGLTLSTLCLVGGFLLVRRR